MIIAIRMSSLRLSILRAVLSLSFFFGISVLLLTTWHGHFHRSQPRTHAHPKHPRTHTPTHPHTHTPTHSRKQDNCRPCGTFCMTMRRTCDANWKGWPPNERAPPIEWNVTGEHGFIQHGSGKYIQIIQKTE